MGISTVSRSLGTPLFQSPHLWFVYNKNYKEEKEQKKGTPELVTWAFQHGLLRQRWDSAAFCLFNKELLQLPWKPKAKERKWKPKVNENQENRETESSLSSRIEQDGHLLTKPGPQLLPLKMSFSPPSTWEKMFQELMQEEKPRAKWTFHLDKNILPNVMAMGWRQYLQTGLGRWVGFGSWSSWRPHWVQNSDWQLAIIKARTSVAS